MADLKKIVDELSVLTVMEAAELSISSSQSTDGILLETETGQSNTLLLDASRP